MTFKLTRDSMIVASVFVSESELKVAKPEFYSGFEDKNPTVFKQWLYELGVDTNLPVAKQRGLKHRNRMNQVVTCDRWLGEERQDADWINSGYASREARDKYSGNRILEDLYRSRNLTVDAQNILEDRDKHTVIDESNWE
jgi:hypothetical protein